MHERNFDVHHTSESGGALGYFVRGGLELRKHILWSEKSVLFDHIKLLPTMKHLCILLN